MRKEIEKSQRTGHLLNLSWGSGICCIHSHRTTGLRWTGQLFFFHYTTIIALTNLLLGILQLSACSLTRPLVHIIKDGLSAVKCLSRWLLFLLFQAICLLRLVVLQNIFCRFLLSHKIFRICNIFVVSDFGEHVLERHTVQSLHHELRSLFSWVLEEGLLAHYIRVFYQLEPLQDLVFEALFVKIVVYGAPDLLDREQFSIRHTAAFFHCPVPTLFQKWKWDFRLSALALKNYQIQRKRLIWAWYKVWDLPLRKKGRSVRCDSAQETRSGVFRLSR